MKNVKTFLKNNIGLLIFISNLVLTIIGIFSAREAVKINQYDNPILNAIPVSAVIWVLIAVFTKNPKRDYTDAYGAYGYGSATTFYLCRGEISENKEETESVGNPSDLHEPKEPPVIVQFIVKTVLFLLFVIFICIVLFDIIMALLLPIKIAVIPALSLFRSMGE